MDKAKLTRYIIAIIACAGVVFLWVLFQVFIAGGLLVGLFFMGVLSFTWSMVINWGKDKEIDQQVEPIENSDDEICQSPSKIGMSLEERVREYENKNQQ